MGRNEIRKGGNRVGLTERRMKQKGIAPSGSD